MKTFGILAGTVFLLSSAAALAQTAPPAPDWIIAANKPCKVWNPEPQPGETVTWSGACKDGFITGKGALRWMQNGKLTVEFDGEFLKGKRNGHGVLIAPNGQRSEGVWVDDKLLTGNNAI